MDLESRSLKWNKVALAFALISIIMIGAIVVIYKLRQESPTIKTKKGTIGIIEIKGVIDSYDYSSLISAAINEALTDETVKAVVIKIDSPGGSAHLCEQIYLDLQELQKIKPIVASVSMALSGGYYIAVSSDYIFAQPTSMVGNVGILAVAPDTIVPSESDIETGPHKITGFSPRLFPLNVSKALDSFINAVTNGRGTSLQINKEQLKMGSVWLGKEAVNNGIIDEMGGQQAALNYAASLVELEEYDIKNMVESASNSTLLTKARKSYISIEELNQHNPPPALYYIYIPGDIYMQEKTNQTLINHELGENITRTGQVIIDLSHNNMVNPWVFDLLEAELAKRDIFVGYSTDWENINKNLEHTSTLIIASPTEYYSFDEYKTIQNWIIKGNMLILFSDPGSAFTSIPELLGPINSLANNWGIHFGKGYLYNQEDNYGIYRNIFIRSFEDSFLTKDLKNLLFFTSTYISSLDSAVAYASKGTYNSVSEQAQPYAPIIVIKEGNSTVIAFGDITWLMEPYIYEEDNLPLLINLVDKIAELNLYEQIP